jgi:hypothetical protein
MGGGQYEPARVGWLTPTTVVERPGDPCYTDCKAGAAICVCLRVETLADPPRLLGRGWPGTLKYIKST